MTVRSFLRIVPLSLLCNPSAFGQLPKRVEKCLPYSTLAQEIQNMQPTQTAPNIAVRVSQVEFSGNDSIPPDTRDEISADLRAQVFHSNSVTDYLDDVADQIAEVNVRNALQNRGYFKAVLSTVKLTTMHTEGAHFTVVAIISAKPGPQWHAGSIRVESADDSSLYFSPAVLRGLMPLQTGDLFNVQAIRTGLDNLRRAYVREGYIDMTAEPSLTSIDEPHNTIDMVLKINQASQYHVGSIEFLGLDTATQQKLLEPLPKYGEIFDGTSLNDFFKRNRAILPPDASTDDVNIRRDTKSQTVALSFDLRTCPPNAD